MRWEGLLRKKNEGFIRYCDLYRFWSRGGQQEQVKEFLLFNKNLIPLNFFKNIFNPHSKKVTFIISLIFIANMICYFYSQKGLGLNLRDRHVYHPNHAFVALDFNIHGHLLPLTPKLFQSINCWFSFNYASMALPLLINWEQFFFFIIWMEIWECACDRRFY